MSPSLFYKDVAVSSPARHSLHSLLQMTTNASPYAAFIGIDRSDRNIDATILHPNGDQAAYERVSTKPSSLRDWLYQVRDDFSNGPLAICIEQPCANLTAFLSQFDFVVLFLINPATLKRWREAFQVSKAKDDRNDSKHLAQLVHERHAKLQAWCPQDADTRMLRRLCESRRHLVNRRTQLTNQLKAILKDYFPLALEITGREIHTRLACRFLTKWPSLERLQRAEPERIRSFYYLHGSRRPKVIDQRLADIAEAVPLTEDPAIVKPAIMMVKAIVKQLDALRQHIDQFEAAIDKLYHSHKDAAIFESLPGAGSVLGSRLLVSFGSDRDRYENASAVQKFCGIAPVTKQSGRTRVVSRRLASPHFERQTFIEWVGQTVIKSVWAKAFYQRMKDKGMGHWSALRSLAYRWIRVIYRCWKDRQPYDEERYIKCLTATGSPLAPIIRELQSSANNPTNNSQEFTC